MSASVETLVLTRSDVERCLAPAACREAIARAFERFAHGGVPRPRALAFESGGGGFHVKAALSATEPRRFVAKLNGNFPGNPAAHALPTIQGVLLLADAQDGRPLAVMDSGSVTAIRTAAASMVAADRLARADAGIAAIIGCGLQGVAHADALLGWRPLRELRLHDAQPARAAALADHVGARSRTTVHVASSVADAVRGADVIVTCTTGGGFVLADADMAPGAFVAAVGADHPYKRELDPELTRRTRVVVDDLAQCAESGDLHHAIAAGVMTAGDVHGDLASIVAGLRPGRTHERERFVFDSTGIALEDAAAADVAYERALALGVGQRVRFAA